MQISLPCLSSPCVPHTFVHLQPILIASVSDSAMCGGRCKPRQPLQRAHDKRPRRWHEPADSTSPRTSTKQAKAAHRVARPGVIVVVRWQPRTASAALGVYDLIDWYTSRNHSGLCQSSDATRCFSS